MRVPNYKSSLLPLFIGLVLSLQHVSSSAQQDTVFWFAPPEISSSEGDNPIYLRLMSYGAPATVTISQPANVGFTPIVVNLLANEYDLVDLSPFLAMIESPAANVVSNNGLKILSTAPITAYYELLETNNKEIFSLKGTKATGTNFYTPFQEFWDNAVTAPSTFSSIDIVATEDNTTVLITPRADVVGHVADFTYSVILMEGETYSARDLDVSAGTSLSGSIISSDNPISVTVFSGALMHGGCQSSMGDQISSTDYIGNDYIVRDGATDGDRIYILATQNGTSIDIDDGTTTTSTLINWGETYEYVLADTVNYIQCSKPVYLLHASGYGCNLAGAQQPGLFCSGKYEQTFVRTSTDSLAIILYTRAGFEDDFLLNGSAAITPTSGFAVVPGTSGEFVVGLFYPTLAEIPVDSIFTVTNSEDIFGLGIMQGSSSNGAAYAYVSEFLSYPFIDAGPSVDTVCANVNYPVVGQVGGGSVTAVWGSTGFGSFEFGVDTLANTYLPSAIDSIISPIELIITSTGPCPVQKDTLTLYVTPAPVVNAGPNQEVCANNADVTLSGSVIGGLTTGTWSTLGSGTFTPHPDTLDGTYIPSDADTTAGTVTLVLTSSGATACNHETDTMVLTITPAPFVDAGPATMDVCENNTVFSLNGTVYGGTTTGKWTTSGNGSFFPDNLNLACTYTPSPTDLMGGSITLYLESTGNGSCNSEIDSILVTFTPAPSVDAGLDIIACTNESVVDLAGIISGPTTTGQWTGGLGSYTPNDSTLDGSYVPTLAEILGGAITLTLTSTNNGGCNPETDNLNINFVAPPFANFDFTEVCQNLETNFTDFSLNGFGTIDTWTWDFDDTNTSSDQNPDHTYASWGTYNVQLIVESNVGCSDTIVQAVDVFELPVAAFIWDPSCDNNLVIIDFFDTSTCSSDAIDYWFYDFGGIGSQAAPDPTQLFIGNGDFEITHIVKTENNCYDTIVETITIPPFPSAGFYYNNVGGLNIGAEFNFIDTSSNANSWLWVFDNGDSSVVQDPTTTYFSNDTYTITQYAWGPMGCIDSAKVTVNINTITDVINDLIPNAISPNGDGKNDVWKLNFIEFVNPEAEIVVFNRWGQTLYQSIGYSDPWDGTYRGDPVPEGTYFYIIKISDEEIYKGSILVLTSRDN